MKSTFYLGMERVGESEFIGPSGELLITFGINASVYTRLFLLYVHEVLTDSLSGGKWFSRDPNGISPVYWFGSCNIHTEGDNPRFRLSIDAGPSGQIQKLYVDQSYIYDAKSSSKWNKVIKKEATLQAKNPRVPRF